jgi:prepilin-type N-terminal cleavage/methylation domain-containing protein
MSHWNVCLPSGVARTFQSAARSRAAFTLIELILVMAILTVAVSVTAPTMSRFFRGRTLDSEARRLLSLTRNAQMRAATEGIPMDVWIDASKNTYGLEAEPSYEAQDSHGIICELDPGLKIEAVEQALAAQPVVAFGQKQISTISVRRVIPAHAGLPTIRFLPDGGISESSPQKVKLIGNEGETYWLAQARDRLSYEIRSKDE